MKHINFRVCQCSFETKQFFSFGLAKSKSFLAKDRAFPALKGTPSSNPIGKIDNRAMLSKVKYLRPSEQPTTVPALADCKRLRPIGSFEMFRFCFCKVDVTSIGSIR